MNTNTQAQCDNDGNTDNGDSNDNTDSDYNRNMFVGFPAQMYGLHHTLYCLLRKHAIHNTDGDNGHDNDDDDDNQNNCGPWLCICMNSHRTTGTGIGMNLKNRLRHMFITVSLQSSIYRTCWGQG